MKSDRGINATIMLTTASTTLARARGGQASSWGANNSRVLDDTDIHVCLLPPNSTQPMDLVNKPAEGKFENWCADQIVEQLGEGIEGM